MINILDSGIYNRISAGEVVENTASIVKELVENSIDAGATSIEIYIKDGGINSIEVIDDGAGIPKDELFKMILPHATSKIATADDLDSIATLGFRGEALASICAVSEFTVASKYYEAETGALLQTKGGQDYTLEDSPIVNGTSITVSNLFYNTPARFKFLKSKKGEENGVTTVVLQQIIANPYINFKYYIDDKIVYSAMGNGLLSAISAVYGDEIANKLIYLSGNSSNHIKVTGFISPASLYKNTRGFQTVIINGRIVTDSTISMTVQNAYGERLMHRCFPIFVLNIVMPFDEIDVNVHPNKKEVRFSNARQVYGAIFQEVKYFLEKTETEAASLVIPKKELEQAEKRAPDQMSTPIYTKNDSELPLVNVPKYALGINKAESTLSNKEGFSSKNELSYSDYLNIALLNNNIKNNNTSCVAENNGFMFGGSSTEQQSKHLPTPVLSEEKTSDTPQCKTGSERRIDKLPANYRVVGQIFDTYLVIECQDKMLILDQHAVHERLLYDDLKSELDNDAINIQQLLIPYIYEGSASDINNLLAVASEINKIGFEIEEFGNNSVKISAVPAIMTDINLNKFINDLLTKSSSIVSLSGIIRDKLMSAACKAAIKGGDKLSNAQIELVMAYFTSNTLPLRCPHGRPTYMEFSKIELEKLFRRKI